MARGRGAAPVQAQEEEEVSQIDPGWEHCVLLDARKKKVKCNYCGKEIHDVINRFKQHLAGISGQVKRCEVCPRPLRDEFRALLLGKQRLKEFRAGQEADLRDKLAGRPTRPPVSAPGGVSLREGRDPTYIPVGDDSDSDDDDNQDPELRAARAESMRTMQEDQERRRGARSSGTGAAGPFPTASSVPLRRSGSQAAPPPVGSMDHYVHRRRSSKQPTMKQAFRGVKKSAEVAGQAVKHIFKWFIHAGVPAHAAASPYFQTMIDAVGEAGPGLTAPTPKDIYGVGLQGEVAELQRWVESFKLVWKERGCTLMCDGWTGTTRRSMINFLVYCSEGTVFMKSVDASNNSKNTNYLCGLMDDMVEQIGEENVVQIVTDNEPSYKAAGKKLMDKRRHLYWVPCAAHCLDLMMEDIGKDRFVAELVVQAQKITTFIYGHNRILNMMRQHATNGRDLIRAGPTRFASNLISLESLQRHKHELIAFFNSAEYLEYVQRSLRDESLRTATTVSIIVGDSRFWEKVGHYLKLVEPLVQVLRLVDGDDKNDMGYLYEALDKAKLTMKRKMPRTYKKWWSIIDKRWEMTLHHPLHAAGGVYSPLNTPEDEWVNVIATNVTGSWLVAKHVCRRMRDAKLGGSVINISSISGVGRGQLPGGIAYATSKTALNIMTKVMALELGKYNIRVNSISPGLFKSEITEDLMNKKWINNVAMKTVPLRTYGTSDPALTSLVRYLVDDASNYVTGNIFIVDAGATLPGVPIFSSL